MGLGRPIIGLLSCHFTTKSKQQNHLIWVKGELGDLMLRSIIRVYKIVQIFTILLQTTIKISEFLCVYNIVDVVKLKLTILDVNCTFFVNVWPS